MFSMTWALTAPDDSLSVDQADTVQMWAGPSCIGRYLTVQKETTENPSAMMTTSQVAAIDPDQREELGVWVDPDLVCTRSAYCGGPVGGVHRARVTNPCRI